MILKIIPYLRIFFLVTFKIYTRRKLGNVFFYVYIKDIFFNSSYYLFIIRLIYILSYISINTF